MADIVLVNPRFEVSYWGLEHALPLLGKRANLPVACLPLLAALTPPEHRVTLVDENVEPLDFDRLARADLVGLTGMNVQRRRMGEILTELKGRGVFTAVGGPWVTVQEDAFAGLADVIFVGEAEETWPRFLADWRGGSHRPRYEPSGPTDMTRVPLPRYGLLKTRRYLFGSVQFSRGCPFQCEFCDIIVTFGRRPRLKSPGQFLAEVEALWRLGFEILFIVDDNLIGNQRAVKEMLRQLAAWQRRRGYPVAFFTEASLNLAENEELLRLMVEANIQSVFIGIESPDEESLAETLKFQNIRRGTRLGDRVRKVQEAGLEVWAGMILGFDHDDATVFARQRDFLHEARIVHASVGMLTAIPKTPLHARLAAEGRLDPGDGDGYGTNVIPLRMSRQALRDGFVELMHRLHEPGAYFERLERLYLDPEFRFGGSQRAYWRRHPWTRLRAQTLNLLRCLGLYLRLMASVPDPALRREYRRHLWRLLQSRRDPLVLFVYLVKCAVHYHHHTMAEDMRRGRVINTF